MTIQSIPQKTITATIKEITEAKGGRQGTYHKLTTPPVGQQQYPNIYTVWDSKLLEGIKTGDSVTITLSRGKSKPNATDTNDDKSYYWEVAGIVKVAPSPTTTDSTREPDPLDAELAGKPPAPKPPVAPAQRPPSSPFLPNGTDLRIAKQVALKAAVEDLKGVQHTPQEVLDTAKIFAEWLEA